MSDAWTLLRARRRSTPGAPVVTFVDLAQGERVELSAQSLENAAAKIANGLRDEFGLETGAVVAVHLPVHWQRSAWCAGVWTAGCVVDPGGSPEEADLVVSSADRAAGLAHRSPRGVAVASLHPFGLPLDIPLPGGAFDVTVAVRQQPDSYLFDPPAGALAAMRIDGLVITQEEALGRALDRARAWGLGAGGTLLAGEDLDPWDAWLSALAVPLVAGASVVLASGGGPSGDLLSRERVTATAAR